MHTPLLLILAVSRAHELAVTTSVAGPAVIVRAAYAGSDPVPFAKIQVFSPDAREFQNANTDKRGYFSFVPDAAGLWRVLVDDELGHRREVAVAYASAAGGEPAPTASRLERALLGISLLFGFTGFWYGYRASKMRSQMRP